MGIFHIGSVLKMLAQWLRLIYYFKDKNIFAIFSESNLLIKLKKNQIYSTIMNVSAYGKQVHDSELFLQLFQQSLVWVPFLMEVEVDMN
jgi:hypothetical protein